MNRLALALCLILLGPLAPDCISAEPVSPPSLFLTQDDPAEVEIPDDGSPILRERILRLDPDLDLAGLPRMILNLFPDVQPVAHRLRVERTGPARGSWIGELSGEPGSQVVLVWSDGHIMGNLVRPPHRYHLRYLEGDLHAVREIDQSQFPDEAEPIRIQPELLPSGPAPETRADDGSVIDVMVLYTPDAADGSGDIEAEIQLAVTETNQSYANSGITQRLNLALAALVLYEESHNSSTDLGRIRGTTDGYMDNIHNYRNIHCADMVVLIVENLGGVCGRGYLMTYPSTDFAPWAFSVVQRSCATGYYSFGHELGHNMGAHHDRYVESDPGSYDYSHGFVNVADTWRTVMAYNQECSDSGTSCTRLAYWSNPDVLYGGDPMGIPMGDPASADNRLTLDNTASYVANFRDSGTCGPVTPSLTGWGLTVILAALGWCLTRSRRR